MRVALLCTSIAFVSTAAGVTACGSGDSTSFGDDGGGSGQSTYDAAIDQTVGSSSSGSGSSTGGSGSGSGTSGTGTSGSTGSSGGTGTSGSTGSSGGSGSSSGAWTCSVHCTSEQDCQSGCSPVSGSILCCDVSSAICFMSQQSTCPAAPVDASTD